MVRTILICDKNMCPGELGQIAQTKYSPHLGYGTAFFKCEDCGQLYQTLTDNMYRGVQTFEYKGNFTAEQLKRSAHKYEGLIPAHLEQKLGELKK